MTFPDDLPPPPPSFFAPLPSDEYRAGVERLLSDAEAKIDSQRREIAMLRLSVERWKTEHYRSQRALRRHRSAWVRARRPRWWELRRALAQAVWERDRAEAAVAPLREYHRATCLVGYDPVEWTEDSRRVLAAIHTLNEATEGWQRP